jgi:hypothetical protein
LYFQSDGRKKDFETIDALIEEEFDFYMDEGFEEILKDAMLYKR